MFAYIKAIITLGMSILDDEALLSPLHMGCGRCETLKLCLIRWGWCELKHMVRGRCELKALYLVK